MFCISIAEMRSEDFCLTVAVMLSMPVSSVPCFPHWSKGYDNTNVGMQTSSSWLQSVPQALPFVPCPLAWKLNPLSYCCVFWGGWLTHPHACERGEALEKSTKKPGSARSAWCPSCISLVSASSHVCQALCHSVSALQNVPECSRAGRMLLEKIPGHDPMGRAWSCKAVADPLSVAVWLLRCHSSSALPCGYFGLSHFFHSFWISFQLFWGQQIESWAPKALEDVGSRKVKVFSPCYSNRLK